MLDFSYVFRSGLDGTGESRSDLVSAVVSVDLPLFAANRQDREVAAARADARSLHDMHVDHQRELNGELVEAWQVAKQTSELEAFYASELLPLADQSVQAALLGWRNDRAGIDEVVKARRVALETRLKHLRLAADRALAHFDIDYLAGEQP
jgi:outer membrane protein TolC